MGVIPAHTFDLDTGADSVGFSPLSGMVIDAAGHVTYDFDGHIHARGLDLDATPSGGPLSNPDDEIRWLRASNGALVAGIVGYLDGNNEDHLFSSAVGPTWTSGFDCFGGGPLGGVPRVDVLVGAQVETLLDGDGRSDWLQVRKGGSGQISAGGPNLWGTIVVNVPRPCKQLLVKGTSTGYTPGLANTSWNMLWDGVAVASQGMFFNTGGQHLQLPECVANLANVAAGNHTLALLVTANLQVNTDDSCSWSIVG